MDITVKFESKVRIEGIEAIIDVKIPNDISAQTNSYTAYAKGYSQAFEDLAKEMTMTFNYGTNNVNQIIRRLNERNRSDFVSE